ncbi:MAG: FG-GAP repeat domain-containing protein [Polyangiaceae bacterium]
MSVTTVLTSRARAPVSLVGAPLGETRAVFTLMIRVVRVIHEGVLSAKDPQSDFLFVDRGILRHAQNDMRRVGAVKTGLVLIAFGACGGSGNHGAPAGEAGTSPMVDGGQTMGEASVLADGALASTPACAAGTSAGAVQKPTFLFNLAPGETGWFSSPGVYDLNGDGKKEIVAPLYSTFVYDAQGHQLAKGTATQGRVYAPGVVADLDKDGIPEIVVGGNNGSVAAYEWKGGTLSVKTGWPASTNSGGDSPEARGMAAADLNGDGIIETVVTTTNTATTGSQVFVFEPDGTLYQPPGLTFTAWPRYNTATGTGNDADFNGQGNQGYGCYGENVGIGNVDDDANLEIVVTYDNHQINLFKHDGTSVLASSYYTNPQTKYLGDRMGWGQFIRWVDPMVEAEAYNAHTLSPDINQTMWLEWTASPPNVVDVNGDGKNEVVGIPNAEEHTPYVTQGFAFMVLEGAYGDGSLSVRRLDAFDTLPMSDQPTPRASDDYYPPDGIPAPTTVNIVGDARPEIVAAINDGYIYAISPDGQRLWRYDYANGAPKTFASEVTVADLNQDGVPELVFGTYSLQANAGRLVVLENTGALLYDITLPNQGMDGNGIGVPAAPTIADIDGDGTLEILLLTFDHGIDVFHVPGSGTGCVLWPTGRGNLLRNGMGPSTAK